MAVRTRRRQPARVGKDNSSKNRDGRRLDVGQHDGQSKARVGNETRPTIPPKHKTYTANTRAGSLRRHPGRAVHFNTDRAERSSGRGQGGAREEPHQRVSAQAMCASREWWTVGAHRVLERSVSIEPQLPGSRQHRSQGRGSKPEACDDAQPAW